MTWPIELQREVERRESGRCEYCRMHQVLQGARFHIEHVVPRCRGGDSTSDNLALACPGCNLHKADRVNVADPGTGVIVALFHPRADRWDEHFRWDHYDIVPLSSIGRATAAALDFNHPRRVQILRAKELFSLFPP